ncbi:SDR family oxidoreductase [Mucilaginibacter sp. McL0603]|uniref:SDR family oxidoreductase n=1 Tax=Mucilaginibacter sp. McL0603 TaxID=3415670 RepID=UPI003CE9E39C
MDNSNGKVIKRFDKRTVIITGGARGLGASMVRGFVTEGANVVIADVLEREGLALADELGDKVIFSLLDVTSEKDWTATIAAAENTFGSISVLVNNAAIVHFEPIAETEPVAWRKVIDINLTGTYLGIRAVVPSMRKAGSGSIVNISAAAGMTGMWGAGAYVASKWGGRGLTKTAALELGQDNIRVNSIHPGAVRTHMASGLDTSGIAAPEVKDLAIPRIAEPDEITRLALFVASDEASFSTGSEFVADGGYLLGPAPVFGRTTAGNGKAIKQ